MKTFLLLYANKSFDFFGYYYLKTCDLYKYYIPQDTNKIQKIILHYGEGQNIELTSYIEKDDLKYTDLYDFLRNIKSLPPLLGEGEDHKLHLEIVYRQSDEKYRIMYGEDDQINFPVYNDDEVQSHNVIDTYKNGVLSAFYQDQDVTNIIKEYAGPKGNFYHDRDIYITMDKMRYVLHTYRDKDDKNHQLIITDNFADDHVFKERDALVLSSLGASD